MENEKRIDGIYNGKKESAENLQQAIDDLDKGRGILIAGWQKKNDFLNKVREEKGDRVGNEVEEAMDKIAQEAIKLNDKIEKLRKEKRNIDRQGAIEKKGGLAIRENEEIDGLAEEMKHNEEYIKDLEMRAKYLKSKHLFGWDAGKDYDDWKKTTDRLKEIKARQEKVEDRIWDLAHSIYTK